jgi:UDP-N-acetylglucosamine 1-carboxyvinyltransferase
MGALIVEGGKKLKGSIAVTGNKNEALPVIAASLLCDGAVKLSNVPLIGDVQNMLGIARKLGVSVSEPAGGRVRIESRKIDTSVLPVGLSSRIRGSVLFASALLGRTGKAVIAQPGGDKIGRRRLDTHFHVFHSLGARLRIEGKVRGGEVSRGVTYILEAPKGLRGAPIHLDEASVTATENALIAAAGARGKTIIANAASEPHVQGLCRMLQGMGVRIEGAGSNVLTVHGTASFGPVDHCLGGDYIEAGSLVGLAAATRSEITVTNVNASDLRMILFQFERLGVHVEVDAEKGTLHVGANQRMRIRPDMGGGIPKIDDGPWPAFPADLMSIVLVTATQCRGTCLVHEKMFEARLFFVDKLIGMGAQIVLCDPHRAVIAGPTPLVGEQIASPDIRAGMAMLIAALAAEGRSVIYNCEQIDRGYQRIDKRLNALGAHIERSVERRKS